MCALEPGAAPLPPVDCRRRLSGGEAGVRAGVPSIAFARFHQLPRVKTKVAAPRSGMRRCASDTAPTPDHQPDASASQRQPRRADACPLRWRQVPRQALPPQAEKGSCSFWTAPRISKLFWAEVMFERRLGVADVILAVSYAPSLSQAVAPTAESLGSGSGTAPSMTCPSVAQLSAGEFFCGNISLSAFYG